MLLNCGVGEASWESLGLQADQIHQSYRKSTLNIHWKDRYWSSNTLATWCEELSHWKRPWCWARLKAGRVGDDRGWDGWMASLMWCTWTWVNSRRWQGTGKPGMLQSMRSQRARQDLMTDSQQQQMNTGLFTKWQVAVKCYNTHLFCDLGEIMCETYAYRYFLTVYWTLKLFLKCFLKM